MGSTPYSAARWLSSSSLRLRSRSWRACLSADVTSPPSMVCCQRNWLKAALAISASSSMRSKSRLVLGKHLAMLSAGHYRHRLAHGIQRCETNQSVASTYVEINVRQRLYLVVPLQLGHQLQKESQLAYLYRLFHDVHPVEIVQDDGLEDEYRSLGCLSTCSRMRRKSPKC